MVWTLNVLLSALVDSSLSMLMKNILNFALFCIFESSIIMNFQSFDSVQCTYNIEELAEGINRKYFNFYYKN